MLASSLKRPRKGIILLVVLALLTLFASVGVAFVYFAEQEATKSLDQKAGETIKLPDADMLYAYAMRQVVFPTNNNASVLYTHSLLENMYGNKGVVPFSGTGPKPHMYRDHRPPGTLDPQVALAGYDTNTGLIGQDELFRINRQFRTFNEALMGSLNPTYTYPDHKNAFLAAVAANWTDMNGTQHGPVALARSFAREMKFRIAVKDTTVAPGNPNVVRYQDVILNPYSSNIFPNGRRHYDFWLYAAGGGVFTMPIGDLPLATAPQEYVPNSIVQCNTNGTNAVLTLDTATCRAHTLRPDPRNNPNFPPPGDLGGDVKNLPPEVKTLVGFNGTIPIFANNDAYWMDLGFPAIPWSNNRKVKPLFAVTIVDNDGRVNMNTAGNLRGYDNTNGSYHVSSHGLGPWEVNPRKIYPAAATPAQALQMDQEIRQLISGVQLSQNNVLRGRNGIDPYPGPGIPDPITAMSNYWPLLRSAPFYSSYNADGTYDNLTAPLPNYSFSPAYTLPGQSLAYGRFPANNGLALGYGNASINEWMRNAAVRSPLFTSPFALPQPPTPVATAQRSFALQNMEAMYRVQDTGGDKVDSDLRRLMPLAFTDPRTRWQMTGTSMDLNVAAVAPWFSTNTGNATLPNAPVPPARAVLDSNLSRPAGQSQQMPWYPPYTNVPPPPPVVTPVSLGEFVAQAQPVLWRSIFGNTDRIDLAKQLPDYPMPVNALGNVDPTVQLNMGNTVVKAQYMVALHARQKLADQIFWRLVNLTHPDTTAGPTSMNSPRWLAQLAVNIVDYIDNDDYPTWYQVPTVTVNPATNELTAAPSTPNADNIVWGTELPRLVINEVYAEAVNSTTTTSGLGNTIADRDYHVRHWVELYNPLNNPPAPFIGWPDGANARLTVNGTSVYRLVISPQNNMTNVRSNKANTLGYPNDTSNNKTNVVLFNGTTAANSNIPPSDSNFGPYVGPAPPATTPNGFYLVAPLQQPLNTDPMSSFPTMTTNPNNMYESPQMQVDERIGRGTTAFTDNADNRQTILLQRLANPYLPHNPMPGTNVTFTGEAANDPLQPYNPYITIDYVENISPNHAIEHTTEDTATNADLIPVEDRSAIGKMQPYAAMNERPATGPKQLWVTQTPDRDLAVAGIDKLQNQVQHTFFRHNSIEATTAQYGQRPGGATTSAYANTLQQPFDWLVHLDRAPVSPVELLQVSGYRPHELTQQFRIMPDQAASVRADTIPPTPGANVNLTPGTNLHFDIRAGAFFIGGYQGIPYSLKLNDLVFVTYTTTAGTQVTQWVRVNNIDPNYTWFEAEYNSPNTVVVSKSATAKIVIPFAHAAPWNRVPTNAVGETADVQSSNRIYRLLECLAVRNPGVDIGQVRFTGNTNAIQANDPVTGTRWITLNNTAGIAGMPMITTNDALLALSTGMPVPILTPANANAPSYAPFFNGNANYPSGVGDTIVFFAGAPNEYRSTVLEVNWQTNSIRTVLPDSVLPASRTYTVDYAYHSGRQPGKINLNTVWDLETFLALADVKPMNAFWHDPKAIPPNVPLPPANIDREALAKLAFQRLYTQRQFGYFDIPRLPGHTGINNVGEDRPLQGMGTGDIATDIEIARQGIGNTLLSTRYREGGYAPYEANGPKAGLTPIYSSRERDLASLFEFYLPQPAIPAAPAVPTYLPDPGMNHPYRRFELLSKIWNNATVRSNTFSVWVTVGFFEYDESTNSLGAELGQINGKNTRHRFFSVVDRTSIDSWMKSWQLQDPNASLDLFASSSRFPNLDPRVMSFANIHNPDLHNGNAIPTPVPVQTQVKEVLSNNFGVVAGTGNVWRFGCLPEYMSTYARNPLWNMFGQIVQVTSLDAAGTPIQSEITTLLDPTPTTTNYNPGNVYPPQYANYLAVPKTDVFARITLQHSGAAYMVIQPAALPPTVLHWSQLK